MTRAAEVSPFSVPPYSAGIRNPGINVDCLELSTEVIQHRAYVVLEFVPLVG
jgi:hypothetical protein